jgi:hypothetical protein
MQENNPNRSVQNKKHMMKNQSASNIFYQGEKSLQWAL